ncbi:MAG: hypothetical protein WCG80_00025 [Spirochaetales bacterium]
MRLPAVTVLFGLLVSASCATTHEEEYVRDSDNTVIHRTIDGRVYLERTIPDEHGNPMTVRYEVDADED